MDYLSLFLYTKTPLLLHTKTPLLVYTQVSQHMDYLASAYLVLMLGPMIVG